MNLAPRVNASRISEQEYRSLKERLSYSLLKLYDSDRERFFKEVILGEKRIEKQSNSLILGSLVHCLLAGSDGKFDEKFVIGQTPKPGGQMGDLCDALYTRSLQSMNKFYEQQDHFDVIFSDAFQKVKYDFNGEEVAFKKKDLATVLEKFEGSNSELYYNSCLEAIGRTVVSVPLIEQAERLVQKIKESPVTSEIVNQKTEWIDKVRDIKAIEVYNELPILFDVKTDEENDNEISVPYRCMPDRMHVNHVLKIIDIYDWKCSWDNESPEGSLLKYGYYLQAALYQYGVRKWAKEHGLIGYAVRPPKFVFIDVSGFNWPLVLELSQDDIERANRGFKIRGTRYSGLQEIQESIAWNLETAIWGTTKRLFENKGVHKLNLQYGSGR